ncbi:hypothetical protein D3C85_1521840 [compost metagenome]
MWAGNRVAPALSPQNSTFMTDCGLTFRAKEVSRRRMPPFFSSRVANRESSTVKRAGSQLPNWPLRFTFPIFWNMCADTRLTSGKPSTYMAASSM